MKFFEIFGDLFCAVRIFREDAAVERGGGMEIAIDRAVVAEEEERGLADTEGDLLP